VNERYASRAIHSMNLFVDQIYKSLIGGWGIWESLLEDVCYLFWEIDALCSVCESWEHPEIVS
jgi:hypothetical protein